MEEKLEIERKWLLVGELDFPEEIDIQKIGITQVYLLSDKKERLRTSKIGNETKYTHTIKRSAPIGNWEMEREITEEEYCQLVLRADKDCYIILKERNVFCMNGLKYELDIFIHPVKLKILEVEVPELSMDVAIPEWIGRVIEVTGIKGFSNKKIAMKPEVAIKKAKELALEKTL